MAESERIPTLFNSGGGVWNACLNYRPDMLRAYASGYRLAAGILLDQLRDGQQDKLVYPILFLYRHYLELRLKDLLYYGSRLLDAPQAVPNKHELLFLWRKCRPILEHFPPKSQPQLDVVESVLDQLEGRDPKATAFRYPTDTTGARSLAGQRHANLAHLYEAFERTADFLDGASCGISTWLEGKYGSLGQARQGAARRQAEVARLC